MTVVTGNKEVTDLFTLPAKTVRPRKRTYRHFSVAAISNGKMLTEAGELLDADLHTMLPNMPPTLFAKCGAADFIAELHAQFADDNRWQWRATPQRREIIHPNGTHIATRESTAIHYFGFMTRGKAGNYHKIIDPLTMYGHKLETIWPHNTEAIKALLHWAIALRDFCDKNGLEVKPTIGGIASQCLRDHRFYPDARRKVPAKINARAREALPGNHYLLSVSPSPRHEFRGIYLDQHRAHHHHAKTTPLPDSNRLYAHGRFIDLAETIFKDTWPNFYGLYCLKLTAPPRRQSHWVKNPERAFVFSNELPHLLDDGYRVEGVYAAWGSFERDTGLARYAAWSEAQLDHYGDQPWLKPLLLSTYGTLATRAKVIETVFRSAKNGEPTTLLTGRHELPGTLVKTSRKLEPGIVNVLHRGMIEAATRSESIGFAQYLSFRGIRILSIYADAVIVEDDPDKPLPSLLEPWRCKTELNHLRFINQQAFQSGEMTKLPGVGRELRAYRQATPGHAPRRIMYDALTGKKIHTDRRI